VATAGQPAGRYDENDEDVLVADREVLGDAAAPAASAADLAVAVDVADDVVMGGESAGDLVVRLGSVAERAAAVARWT
jgi:hypothetical protein